MADVVNADPRGLVCEPGGFHVDPWEPVDRAVVTHAHADHLRPGSREVHCAASAVPVVTRRLGDAGGRVIGHEWGETFELGDVRVSLHPAGHVRGSAQVRIDDAREVWVVTGDVKRDADPSAEPFELVPCDVLVTEATFALPIYRWPSPEAELDRLIAAMDVAERAGHAVVVFAYALGKTQRLLAMLAARGESRPVYTHGAVEGITELYREAGVPMRPTTRVADTGRSKLPPGALVLAPPSAAGTPWMRRFASATRAMASGWMRLRGPRRRRAVDLGLVLSDHADWPALLRTVEESGARRVLVTHGYAAPLARYLRDERGLDAHPIETRWEGEPTSEGRA